MFVDREQGGLHVVEFAREVLLHDDAATGFADPHCRRTQLIGEFDLDGRLQRGETFEIQLGGKADDGGRAGLCRSITNGIE